MRGLLLACAGAEDRQFSGLRRLMARLSAASPGMRCWEWNGKALELGRRRQLRVVLVSGHGAPDQACFRGPAGCLTPERLRLPPRARLYLLGCHQGRPEHLRAWAAGTGLQPDRVRGPEGETESAFSTCLLLHLLEDGVDSLEGWFDAWRRCNAELRPHFPALRASYTQCAGDPLCAWERVRELPALQPHHEFLSAGLRHPDYLTGLA